MNLARGLGFPTVQHYSGLSSAETQSQQTPLLFFLFAAVDEVAGLKRVADAIRFSPSRRIRFSPLVYFSESPQRETIAQCIGMGFDDVITLPFTRQRIEERLVRLVDHTQVYYETAAYLGPDRGTQFHDIVGQYRRLEIIRTPKSGVAVVRDEMRTAH